MNSLLTESHLIGRNNVNSGTNDFIAIKTIQKSRNIYVENPLIYVKKKKSKSLLRIWMYKPVYKGKIVS